ncbi:MAG TPA: biotin--[acetyl-CoA-carboxylase] ligase [bacterium]|nr:biotin--[acetyl-CoA-carboxylase] ligase [bacterium]
MKADILRALETSVLGQSLNVFDEAVSTNELARQRARAGGGEGETFLALKQTGGRGRLGRSWESPAGKNLLLSVILKPSCSLADASLLTLVAGAAAFDLLSSYLAESPASPGFKDLTIKWPNDVYWKDRKVAGILSEMESEGDSIRYVVCGVGANVNAVEADFSPEIRDKAASLKTILGRETPLAEAAARFLNFLEKRYQTFLKRGSSDLIRFCDERSYLKGRKILFEAPEGKLTGTALSLSPQGHLLVRNRDGSVIPLSSGEVTIKDIL